MQQIDVTASTAIPPARASAEFLLLSTVNAASSARVGRELALAGMRVSETALGLEVCCAGLDWHMVLELIAMRLSPQEQRSTRVAVVKQGEAGNPAALHQAIFRSHVLEELIGQVQCAWFSGVMDRRDGVTIHLQPLLQYPPGRIHGYECLLRGVDADGQIISPNRMFEAARRLDRVAELDERCRLTALRTACRFMRPGLTFFINFVPGAVADARRSLGAAMDVLNGAGVNPGQIAFEVVETDKVQSQRELKDLLRAYRKAGFKVALDDVGAGYSTLLSLAEMRPDYIKLDGELVRRSADSGLEAKLVRDLAETARQNGIITIAEGIETAAQMQSVLGAGVRITQGYFHARPQASPLDAEIAVCALAKIANAAREGAGVGAMRAA